MRAYEVRTAIDGYQHADVRFGSTVAKVRAAVWRSARDAWPDIEFRHIRVKHIGERSTPRQIEQRKADEFNAVAPPGTWVLVRCWIDDPTLEGAFCTQVREPGAWVLGGEIKPSAVVKVPGDSYAIECVTPIRWTEAAH